MITKSMRAFLDAHHGWMGCWLWPLHLDADGYGRTKVGGKTVIAHRAVWKFLIGPLTSADYLCHRCDTPACCNPLHMFVGSAKSNYDDSRAKGRASVGERVGTSILTVPQIREIKTSTRRQIDLAQKFGVTQQAISMIKTGNNWRGAT